LYLGPKFFKPTIEILNVEFRNSERFLVVKMALNAIIFVTNVTILAVWMLTFVFVLQIMIRTKFLSFNIYFM